MRADPVVTHSDWTINDRNRPAIWAFDDRSNRLSLRHRRQEAVAVFGWIPDEVSGRFAKPDNLRKGTAGLQNGGRQPIHLNVALIANDKTPDRIEHDDALRHVIQRRGQ